MTGVQTLTHEFVEYVPRELKDGVLYVSIPFATVIHKCGCGCGLQVVTPLAPSQWSLTFDGKTISLHPSIGNWNFPCKSHYWIKRNQVVWARQWTKAEIAAGQSRDARAVEDEFATIGPPARESPLETATKPAPRRDGVFAKLKRRFFGNK
jgi:hypothetical protein